METILEKMIYLLECGIVGFGILFVLSIIVAWVLALIEVVNGDEDNG